MSFQRYWIYLLVFLLPFERIPTLDIPVFGSTVTLRLSYIVAGLALILLGWGVVRSLPWRSLAYPHVWLALYLLVAGISVAQALNPKRGVIAMIATTLVICTCVVVSRSVKRLNWTLLFKVLTVTAVLACGVGIFQFFGDSLGLSHHITGLKQIYTKSVFGFPRIQSTGLEPLYFANFLLLPLLATFALLYARRLQRWWWYALLALYTYIMTLTLSRGAMWGTVAGVIFISIVLVRRTSWKRATMVFLALAVGVGATIGSIYAVTQPKQQQGAKAVQTYTKQSTTFTPSAASADSDRVTNRKLAAQAFIDNPWLGVGLGNFGTYAKQERPLLYGSTAGEVTVNNEYYEILAETGVLGILTLGGFFITLLIYCLRVWRRLAGYEQVWMVAFVAILGAYAVQYYAFSTLYVLHIWVVIGLMLGLALPRNGIPPLTKK